jgi:hypothetical protein
MIDFDFRPTSYFDGTGPTALIAKLNYPESQWGDEISLYATPVDGVIFFEAIDFYGNDFALNPKETHTTLSLQELIFMIETFEVIKTGSEGNVHLTLSGIPEAESLIYPQLKEYFQEKRKNFGLI